MKPSTATTAALASIPCEELTSRYEELRRNIVSGDARALSGYAFAVFLRRGMTGWMKAWSEFVPSQPNHRRESTSSQSTTVPKAIAPEVVNVLAQMALGTQ